MLPEQINTFFNELKTGDMFEIAVDDGRWEPARLLSFDGSEEAQARCLVFKDKFESTCFCGVDDITGLAHKETHCK